MEEKISKENKPNKIGWVVVFLGIYLLINQIAPGWLRMDLFWPVAIILTGVYLLVRK